MARLHLPRVSLPLTFCFLTVIRKAVERTRHSPGKALVKVTFVLLSSLLHKLWKGNGGRARRWGEQPGLSGEWGREFTYN